MLKVPLPTASNPPETKVNAPLPFKLPPVIFKAFAERESGKVSSALRRPTSAEVSPDIGEAEYPLKALSPFGIAEESYMAKSVPRATLGIIPLKMRLAKLAVPVFTNTLLVFPIS